MMFDVNRNGHQRIVVALILGLLLAPAAASADPPLDQMMQQVQSKQQKPLSGSEPCHGIVEIKYETEVSESPEGPTIRFRMVNISSHTIAVKFGFHLIATTGQQYTLSLANALGAGRLDAGKTSSPTARSGMFPNSIAVNGDHPQILDVKITPIWVAPNIDVEPPSVPAGAYIDTWHDYPNIEKC
jgi:hypothetical protein